MKSKIVLTIMICMAVFSLSARQDENFDYGSIKGSVYTNSYFGITVSFPKSWHVMNQEQKKDIAEQGANAIAGNNKKIGARCKTAEVNTANLLTVSKYSVERSDEFNPCFMLVAENLGGSPDTKTALDYLFKVKVLSLKTGIFNKINENFVKKEIDGQEFYELYASVVYDDMEMVQKYYTCIKKGFALSIIIFYSSDQGNRDVHAILNKVKFNKI